MLRLVYVIALAIVLSSGASALAATPAQGAALAATRAYAKALGISGGNGDCAPVFRDWTICGLSIGEGRVDYLVHKLNGSWQVHAHIGGGAASAEYFESHFKVPVDVATHFGYHAHAAQADASTPRMKVTPFGAVLIAYAHATPSVLNDSYMYGLAISGLADIFPGYCPKGSLNEFALHSLVPKWREAMLRAGVEPLRETLTFRTSIGIYDFAKSALPIGDGGAYEVDVYNADGGGLAMDCRVPYANAVSPPGYAQFMIDNGVIPSFVSVAPGIAQTLVNRTREATVTISLEIRNVTFEGGAIPFKVTTRPLWLHIDVANHVLYRKDFH